MDGSLRAWAMAKGYAVAWAPAEVVASARADVVGRHTAGELDEVLYRAGLEPVARAGSGSTGGTVVMVALPRPAHRVGFEVAGGTLQGILPPTYLRYRATFEEVRLDLAAHGLPGEKVEHLVAPLKAVASRLGLVRYGRNNLVYAAGLGSYLQLCGFLTDADLGASSMECAREPALLAECEGCDRCRAACPTGAIGDDRVMLHAERCLTFANENPGAWPAWVPVRAHHCLMGCLACQRCCPANSTLPVEDSGVRFSASETAALLDDDEPPDQHAESGVRAKLAWLGQPGMEGVLGRNLRALVGTRKGPTPRVRACRPPG